MGYINYQSFRCLLGVQAKDVQIVDNLFLWKVGKKQHFTVENILTPSNLLTLAPYVPSNFHYLNATSIENLKSVCKVHKVKNTSIIINIEDLSFTGNAYKNIRHCLNRAAKNNFTLESNFRDLGDVKKLVNEWSDHYTDKYFRDNSGKNFQFYKQGYHQGLVSLFVYHQDDLVAFGTLSTPDDGNSSYIVGKALYQRHYGLSEFADVELYKRGQLLGIKNVNLGQASKGLLAYKKQFQHSEEIHYDGSVEI
jgi:hypothetical protein